MPIFGQKKKVFNGTIIKHLQLTIISLRERITKILFYLICGHYLHMPFNLKHALLRLKLLQQRLIYIFFNFWHDLFQKIFFNIWVSYKLIKWTHRFYEHKCTGSYKIDFIFANTFFGFEMNATHLLETTFVFKDYVVILEFFFFF